MSLITVLTRSLIGGRKLLLYPLVALLGAAGVSSCSVMDSRYPLNPSALKTRGLQPNEGYIVATFKSVTVDRKGGKGKLGAMSSVHMQGVGSQKGTAAQLSPDVMPTNRNPHLLGNGQFSEVIAIPVPAGEYEINSWRMLGYDSSGSVTLRNRGVLKVPVHVRPGEATYVGSYLAVAVTGRNLLNLPLLADGAILAKNDYVEDQARIAKYYSSIPKAKIRNSNVAETYMLEMKRIAKTPDVTIWNMFKERKNP